MRATQSSIWIHALVGASFCDRPCAVGQYCNGVQCTNCPLGYTTVGEGADGPGDCFVHESTDTDGFDAFGELVDEEALDAGFTSSDDGYVATGLQPCRDVPSGACKRGSFCAVQECGTHGHPCRTVPACEPCPAGTTTQEAGAVAAVACVPCLPLCPEENGVCEPDRAAFLAAEEPDECACPGTPEAECSMAPGFVVLVSAAVWYA